MTKVRLTSAFSSTKGFEDVAIHLQAGQRAGETSLSSEGIMWSSCITKGSQMRSNYKNNMDTINRKEGWSSTVPFKDSHTIDGVGGEER